MSQQDPSDKDAFPDGMTPPDVHREKRCIRGTGIPAGCVPERLPEDGTGDDLAVAVTRSLERYFARLDGREPHPLYDLVVHAVERPLIEYVLSKCRHNQCAAAQLLGINRNTLRKKLREHGLLPAQEDSTKI